jgi:MoxR-like ATPase
LRAVEPVILAALALGDPLLLIGPHGTGKSFLLNRLATALGLEHRHYNASLLSFDDLVGYPLPDQSGTLRYIQTPATIWGAEAVFFDEISRCRPEVQNKLFSIIHERRVQGIALDRLRYRWSAMNPPVTDDVSDYSGSEPLDRALADRFAFITELPDWDALTSEQRQRVVLTDDRCPPSDASAARLKELVARARRVFDVLSKTLAASLSGYVSVVCSLLRQGGFDVTPRRAAMLFRNIVAVHGARLQAAPGAKLEDSACLALTHSLCQRAYGQKTPALKIGAAHKQAWSSMSAQHGTGFEALLTEQDPIRRLVLAAALPSLGKAEFSTIAADCLASVGPGARHALAVELFEGPGADRLVASVAEQCAELYRLPCTPQGLRESVVSGSRRHRVWQHIVQRLARLEKGNPETARTYNLLVALFVAGELDCEPDVDSALDNWLETRARLRELRP